MLIPLFHRIIRRHLLRSGVQSIVLDLRNAVLHSYEIKPESPAGTIVLVHGLGTSASTWIHVLPALGKRYRVLAPDLPGFGFSQRKDPPSFLYLQGFVDALAEFLDKTVSGPLILLGHSLGGWLTMQYAVQHPRLIKHLILVNTAGIYYDGTEKQRELFNLQSPADTRRLLDHIWLRYPWYFRPFNRWIFEDLVARNVPEFVRRIKQEDFMNRSLNHLTMPVSVIWGVDDRLISDETIAVLRKNVSVRQVQTIDQCGHVPQLERPAELLEALGKVLEGVDWNGVGR